MKKLIFKNFFKKTKNRILKSYLSVNYTPKKFKLEDSDKALCLSPHQDDETISMGGTLARFSEQFKVICLTNGARGFKNQNTTKDDCINIRKQEFIEAMKIAKISDFETLEIEDRAMIDGWNIFSKIDISNYDYIFLPNPIDQHKDHKAVSVHLYNLLKQAKRKQNLQIMFYEVWSPLTFATKCIDISEFIETKKAMLESYKSQMGQRSYFKAAVALSEYRGLAKEMDYAEAFWTMSVAEFNDTIENLYEDLIK